MLSEKDKNVIINDKKIKTMLLRYGVENAMMLKEFKEKAKATNLRLYGVENAMHSEVFKEKGRTTNLKKYGVSHPMQNASVFNKVMKSRFKIKQYVSDSGKKYFYQGYEDVVLKHLLNIVPEDWIVNRIKLVPKIMYHNSMLGKNARYYPDIWVKPINLLIEVKSEFTFNINTQVTMDKQNQCIKNGFAHIIVICDKKKLLEII